MRGPEPDQSAGGTELAPGVWAPDGAVSFSFVASGGPGGQNVNKRATKAELRVLLADIPIDPEARERLAALAGRRLSDDGQIVITAEEYRSQGRNRAACLERLRELIIRAMVRPKRRRATRPTRGSRERRLEEKRTRADVKRGRRGGGEE